MKIKVILSILIITTTILGSNNLLSQWEYPTSSRIYTPDRVDIGLNEGHADKRLNVYSSDTYGWQSGSYNLVDFTGGTSFKGNLYGRLAEGSSYSANGGGFGVIGLITDVTELRNTQSTKTSYVFGGSFGINITDPIPVSNRTTGTYLVCGARTYLYGSITTYPTDGVVTALYSRDYIKGAQTWAGYFDGNLAVTDTITANNIKVVSSVPWPDYVFNDNYQLKKLKDLDDYVKTKKHLPGMPSSERVKEEGIDLEKMNIVLLEKVEELSLYVIELNQKIEKLEKQIQQ